MAKIIVIGSSNTDMVIQSDRLPAPGETVLGGTFFMNPGGKGANQAVAAARLGGETYFITKVGKDVFGESALKQFAQEGIHGQFIFQDDLHPSGIALINVDTHGENSITVASGANAHLMPQDIKAAVSLFQPGNCILLQLEIPLETVIYSVQQAKQAGLSVVLNPAPACELPESLYADLDIITPNETETEFLTGIQPVDEASLIQASDYFLSRGVKRVVITRGSQGAYWKTKESSGHILAQQVVAVDSTAAGDCFNGALVVALSEGQDFEQAIAFACRAAAISVTQLGAQASMPRREQL
ncbi:ribokinase [Aquirufa rosea]|uniref:Ribokinase n=1 Tax=Aquirufa rosea TaxID=2509241 RepID=A0A4Q1BZH5_9BACT|nr:ribokinase [Aquirufa rosea]RXK48968.1 ribokinase [Aquirufa rosea]